MSTEAKDINVKSELYERILTTAMKAFVTEGIKPVKMDDIANSLSISKRTLYETFKDKEALLFECVKRRQETSREYMRKVYNEAENTLEVILKFYFTHLEELRRVNHRFFEDMKKYPTICEQIKQERDKSQKETIRFFEKGVKEGLFRDDLNMTLVIRLMSNDQIIKENLGQEFPLDEIFRTQLLIYLRGIATDKGKQILDHIVTENENRTKLN